MSRGTLQRALVMLAALAALAPISSAYYYYVLFANSGGPYVPIPTRFDLNAADSYGLQNNTVTYLISSQGPGTLMPGDTFQAVISQIRSAAEVWNSVSTSGIHLAFGGLSAMTTADSSPEVDVVFSDEIPPGLIAYTTQTTVQNVAPLLGTGATFVPLLRSQVNLRTDLTNPWPQPSYSDEFFLTVAHEFGHALGLQHTKTSSLMSTNITRATTKAHPLAADDMAGISLLYPTAGFAASTGSISGAVSMNGNGVNLATVVALSTFGTAVSTLTNPDGTYQISGIPPGQYYVYVQPLPPAQPGEAYPDNVTPPTDLAGNKYPANTGFVSQFYGGTNDWTQTPQVAVTVANVSSGINFNVQPSAGPGTYNFYDMVLYAYVGNPAAPVQAPALQAGTSATLEFYAQSSANSSGYLNFAPGLNISVIGGAAQIVPNSLAPLAGAAPYLYAYVFLGSVATQTPAALALTLNGDLYVLPQAFTVVPSGPPAVTSVSGNTDNQGNATVTVAGSNLSSNGTSNARIFFDGAPAALQSVNADGSLTVTAPPATNGYHAAVEALTTDGQTSGQTLGTSAPPSFTYGGPAFPALGVSQGPITAGTDTMVAITGFNTNFVSGQTVAGFGTSDIQVTHVWVVSPGRLVMNVSVRSGAQPQTAAITVGSGLELVTLNTALQVAAANPGQISLRTPILNQATQMAGVPLGGTAVINTSGLPSNVAGWTLSIGGQPTSFTVNGSQILAVVPSGLLTGPQVVQLTSPSGAGIPPVLVQVDPLPPVITAAASLSGAAINSSNEANPGQTINLTVSGLADQLGNFPAVTAIDVNIGGLDQNPLSLVPTGTPGVAQLQVVVPGTLGAGTSAVTVRINTRLSPAFQIPVQ